MEKNLLSWFSNLNFRRAEIKTLKVFIGSYGVRESFSEKKRRLEKRLEECKAEVAAAEAVLGLLTPEEREVVEVMLVENRRCASVELADRLHVGISTVYRLRNSAVEKLKKAFMYAEES